MSFLEIPLILDFFKYEKLTLLENFDMYLIVFVIFSQYLVRLRMDRSRACLGGWIWFVTRTSTPPGLIMECGVA